MSHSLAKTSHMANPDNEVGKCPPTERHGNSGGKLHWLKGKSG